MKWLLFFLATPAFAGDPALDKLREAAMIQFGVTKMMDHTKTYVESQLKIRKEVMVVAGIYKIVKEKSIEFKISKDTVKISTNSVGYTHCF